MQINASIIEVALESDARYFEMAANVRDVPGGHLVWIDGLERLSSSAVIQRIDAGQNPDACIPAMEQAARDAGIPSVRLYQHQENTEWEKALIRHRFIPQEELILSARQEDMKKWSGFAPLTMRPVKSDDDWRSRHQLFGTGGKAPDGMVGDVDGYIEMEKRKCAAGGMTMFLFSDEEDRVVASVGLFHLENVARLKNVIVDYRMRKCGMATRMVAEVGRSIMDSGAELVAYQIPRAGKTSLYQRMGFRHITSCYEWKK